MTEELGFESEYEELRGNYIRRWTEKKGRLCDLLNKWSAGEEPLENLRGLRIEFHSLAGNGGTYGFPEVSKCGRNAEDFIKGFLEEGEDVPAGASERIEEFIHALDVIFSEAEGNMGPKSFDAPPASPEIGPGEDKLSPPNPSRVGKKRIAVVDPDPAFAVEVLHILDNIKFDVLVCRKEEDPLKFLLGVQPHIILTEIRIDGGDGFELCRKIKQNPALSDADVVFVSGEADIQNRLKAVRAGGESFFTKPVLRDAFIECIELLSNASDEVPARILSVEDDPDQANFIRHVLTKAGNIVRLCLDPIGLLDAIEEFDPDAILMDVLMPDFNGYELARVIRQNPQHTTLPIIFLTSIRNTKGQIEGFRSGSDGYLTKPIEPNLLVNCIRARTQKSKLIDALSGKDRLTFLANRGALMRQFDSFFQHAKRYKEALSVAIIDIDKFKSINDTYGHAAGDTVLRELARHINASLRHADAAGRYGGEEFVLLFPQTSAESASFVLNRVREEFGRREHFLQSGGPFATTFSGGIATFPEHGETPEALLQAADEALYISKKEGRNCLTISDSQNAASLERPLLPDSVNS